MSRKKSEAELEIENNAALTELVKKWRAEDILAERERCARIAETCRVGGHNWRRDIAAAIRNSND